jgi:hypothetical protein
MPLTPSYKAVLKKFNSSSKDVQSFFDQLPILLNQRFPLEVCLAYAFLRLERGQNRARYCGVVKVHQASSNMANRAISSQHLTREGFLKLYNTVFKVPISDATEKLVKKAESVRDKVIHGKVVDDSEMRAALVDVLFYAEALNAELSVVAGFEPFGDLRGFKGAAKTLSDDTSSWLL